MDTNRLEAIHKNTIQVHTSTCIMVSLVIFIN
jgi:hypothetical protein